MFGGFGGFPFGDFPGFGSPGSSQEDDGPVENERFYELLGVEKNASTNDIKKAFKKKAIKMHPDKGGDPKLFQELSMAHDILSDPEKRKIYDRFGEKGINEGMASGGGHHHEGMDLFDLLTGQHKQKQRGGGKQRTKDITFPLKITLEDVYNGKQSKLAVNRKKLCEDCSGSGGQGGKARTTCSGCKGRGMVTQMQQIGPGMYSQSTGPCGECRGQGTFIDPKHRCKKCKGDGTVKEKKVLTCDVAKGVPDGYKYTFYGEADESPDMQPGDIYVEVHVQDHSMYKRKGFDLIYKTKITLVEALTGFKKQIEHLDGNNRFICSEPGEIISPGDIKTIKELGLPKFTTAWEFGNMFVQFEIDFPANKSLSQNAMNMLRQALPECADMNLEPPSDPKDIHRTETFSEEHLNPYSQSRTGEAYDEDDYRKARGGNVQCATQ